jgi:hypothetical protein
VRPPVRIEGYWVVEYGFFTEPILPAGYIAPSDGRPPLEPIQNLAICTAEGVEGYYLLYCTPDWRYVTSSFYETLEFTKRDPTQEFARNVKVWFKLA